MHPAAWRDEAGHADHSHRIVSAAEQERTVRAAQYRAMMRRRHGLGVWVLTLFLGSNVLAAVVIATLIVLHGWP